VPLGVAKSWIGYLVHQDPPRISITLISKVLVSSRRARAGCRGGGCLWQKAAQANATGMSAAGGS
jgi:hypothetical protein